MELLLVYFLFYRLQPLPARSATAGGRAGPPAKITGFYLIDSMLPDGPASHGRSSKREILPALTLGLVYSAPILRLTRASMLKSLGSRRYLRRRTGGLHHQDLVIR